MVLPVMPVAEAKKKILDKGYALLVLPLIVQLCLLFALTQLLRQAEQEVQAQVRSKAIISQSNALSKLFYDAGVAMGGYSITKSQLFSERYDKIVRQIPEDVKELRSLVEEDQEKQEHVDKLEGITKEGLKILNEAKSAIDDNRIDVAQFRARHMYKQIRQLADQLHDELKSFTLDYRLIEGLSPKEQSRNRTMLKIFLVGWLAFDILLVLALFADFRQAVARIFAGGQAAEAKSKTTDDGPPASEMAANSRPPVDKTRPAFGSKVWQGKRQRFGGKRPKH